MSTEIRLDCEHDYPTWPESEAEAIDAGWVAHWHVRAEYPRDPSDPAEAVFFQLAEGTGREPRRYVDLYDGPDQDAALEHAIAAEANGAVAVHVGEISAALRRDIAAERAFEAQF